MSPIQQAISALEESGAWAPGVGRAMDILRSLQKEVEGVSVEQMISGAIYDFAGFLTTRSQTIKVGASEEATPIANLIVEWAKTRNLSLDDALVERWSTQARAIIRTAVAAALGRGAVAQDEPCFCDLTYPDADPNESCGDCPKRDYKATQPTEPDRAGALVKIGMAAAKVGWRDGELADFVSERLATQPTQAEAPSEREALAAKARGMAKLLNSVKDRSTMGHCARILNMCAAALATQQAVQADPVAEVFRAHYGNRRQNIGFNSVRALVNEDKLPPPGTKLYATPPAPGQVERDREDAENYRWLCSHMIVPSPSLWDRGVAFTTPPMPRKAGQMTKAELDDFIRAARSSEGGAA